MLSDQMMPSKSPGCVPASEFSVFDIDIAVSIRQLRDGEAVRTTPSRVTMKSHWQVAYLFYLHGRSIHSYAESPWLQLSRK